MSNLPINKIIIHCADTPAAMDIGVVEIRKWHTDPKPQGNGWSDIGYHFVIRRDGRVEKGRDVETIGAHAYGHNAGSIGICLVGGRPDSNFTSKQWKALEELVRDLRTLHPNAEVLGHRDVSRKECPTFDARAWAKTL